MREYLYLVCESCGEDDSPYGNRQKFAKQRGTDHWDAGMFYDKLEEWLIFHGNCELSVTGKEPE